MTDLPWPASKSSRLENTLLRLLFGLRSVLVNPCFVLCYETASIFILLLLNNFQLSLQVVIRLCLWTIVSQLGFQSVNCFSYLSDVDSKLFFNTCVSKISFEIFANYSDYVRISRNYFLGEK